MIKPSFRFLCDAQLELTTQYVIAELAGPELDIILNDALNPEVVKLVFTEVKSINPNNYEALVKTLGNKVEILDKDDLYVKVLNFTNKEATAWWSKLSMEYKQSCRNIPEDRIQYIDYEDVIRLWKANYKRLQVKLGKDVSKIFNV